ncbi:MAG TPA: hypothetical protein VGF34_13375 [Stellaceae bacterium]|jgi:hypothetical protein
MRKLLAALLLAVCFCTPQANAFEPGIAPVVSAGAESSRLIKAASGNLYSLYVTTAGAAGYLMTFNAKTVPADGPVTPIECVVAPANNTVSITFHGPPDIYSNGIVAAFSTTGCFTKTSSATAFFKARAQ